MGSASGQGTFGQAQQTVAVEVQPVTKGNLTVAKKIIGDVISDSQSDVSSQVSGDLLSLQVEKGDKVQKGQLLATVDISDTQEAFFKRKLRWKVRNSSLKMLEFQKSRRNKVVGVVAGLLTTGLPLSFSVFIGMIVLAGIAVNNAIILVEYINQLIERGVDKYEAIIEAGRRRLRPILMTTITTVLGMLPMSLGIG